MVRSLILFNCINLRFSTTNFVRSRASNVSSHRCGRGKALRCRRLLFLQLRCCGVGVQSHAYPRCALYGSFCRGRPENVFLSRCRDRLAYVLFCTLLTTSFGRRAPTLLRGYSSNVDGLGQSRLLPRGARVPAPSNIFDCCV